MVKRELKVNLKSLLLWMIVIILLLTLVFCVYPSMTMDTKMIDQMMSMFPKELLGTFNMDVISISTSFGWYATEGLMLTTLLGAMYSASLGASVVLKEENDGTIEFLLSKAISRNKILSSKIIVAISYILIFNFGIMLTTFIGFNVLDDMDYEKWIQLMIFPVFIDILFFFISIFMSNFIKKVRYCMSFSFGIIFITYIINIISTLNEKIEFVKYVSPYNYMDIRNIMAGSSFSIFNIGVLIVLTCLFAFLSYFKYNRKELF